MLGETPGGQAGVKHHAQTSAVGDSFAPICPSRSSRYVITGASRLPGRDQAIRGSCRPGSPISAAGSCPDVRRSRVGNGGRLTQPGRGEGSGANDLPMTRSLAIQASWQRMSRRSPLRDRSAVADKPPRASRQPPLTRLCKGECDRHVSIAGAFPSRPELVHGRRVERRGQGARSCSNAEADASTSRRRSGRRREAAPATTPAVVLPRASESRPRRFASSRSTPTSTISFASGSPSWRSTYLTRLRRREAELLALR